MLNIKCRVFSTSIFCTTLWSEIHSKPATEPSVFCQSFHEAQTIFSHNSKRFGSRNAFYVNYWKVLFFDETQFWSFCETISSPEPLISGKHIEFHQNCLTKRSKFNFMKNKNFPIRRMSSLCQIFWNFEKSRSQLGERSDKPFGWFTIEILCSVAGFELFLFQTVVQKWFTSFKASEPL